MYLREGLKMVKAGIFLDVENLKRCGGWGMRFDVIRKLVEAQGATVIRANAYMVKDDEKELKDHEYRFRQEHIREIFRSCGFKLILKSVNKFTNHEGEIVVKGNTAMELTVDALVQSEELDYVLIGSGDGDFIRLVRALQMKGKRVDILSFSLQHTSNDLRHEADWYFNGCLVPGMIAMNHGKPNRRRGMIYNVSFDGYGFIKYWEGLSALEAVDSVFFHFSDFTNQDGHPLTPDFFQQMQKNQTVLDFELYRKRDGNLVAKDICQFKPNFWTERIGDDEQANDGIAQEDLPKIPDDIQVED